MEGGRWKVLVFDCLWDRCMQMRWLLSYKVKCLEAKAPD